MEAWCRNVGGTGALGQHSWGNPIIGAYVTAISSTWGSALPPSPEQVDPETKEGPRMLMWGKLLGKWLGVGKWGVAYSISPAPKERHYLGARWSSAHISISSEREKGF